MHATGTDLSEVTKGNTFISVLRVLDKSISADHTKCVHFFLANFIKSFSADYAIFTSIVMHMEARDIVCLLAAAHVIGRAVRPHREHLISKLQSPLHAVALRALLSARSLASALSTTSTALAVRDRIIL